MSAAVYVKPKRRITAKLYGGKYHCHNGQPGCKFSTKSLSRMVRHQNSNCNTN